MGNVISGSITSETPKSARDRENDVVSSKGQFEHLPEGMNFKRLLELQVFG